MLKINNITKKYSSKIVVDDINLNLSTGVYGLLGANGSGKTTLMRIICGILKPTSGTVKYNDLNNYDEKFREILGYLPQDFGYYEDFTTFEFLEYIATIKGYTKNIARQKVHDSINLVNLENFSKTKIKNLSGGMKQRIGIAQSILNNPKVLILDEPTVGLDPKERVKFRSIISNLGKDRIVLLSTHIVTDIEYIAKKIIIIKQGKIIKQGSTNEILKVIDNKVFELTIKNNEIAKYENFKIINQKINGDNTTLRVISDTHIENAKVISPNLEDLYLYYFEK